MNQKQIARIRRIMNEEAGNFTDPFTGELNYTGLAEFTCEVLDAYEPGAVIPEIFFDMAFDTMPSNLQ